MRDALLNLPSLDGATPREARPVAHEASPTAHEGSTEPDAHSAGSQLEASPKGSPSLSPSPPLTGLQEQAADLDQALMLEGATAGETPKEGS